MTCPRDRLLLLGYLMLADWTAAERALDALLAEDHEAAEQDDALFARFARALEKTEVSYSIAGLDLVLRTELTKEPCKEARLAGLDALTRQLKRTCLVRTLACVPPARRVAFVLTEILGFSTPAAATALGVTVGTFGVRLTRARADLEAMLAPRCEHMHPGNACRCASRVGVALERGFIKIGERPPEASASEGDRRGYGLRRIFRDLAPR